MKEKEINQRSNKKNRDRCPTYLHGRIKKGNDMKERLVTEVKGGGVENVKVRG